MNSKQVLMEKSSKVIIALLLFLILLCIISFGTKGVHWDNINNKAYWEDTFPNIYRPMEGCIALDVFLIIAYLTIFGLICKPDESISRFVFALTIMMLAIRFLLGVIFLAGENEKGRHIVSDWLSMSSSQKDQLSSDTKKYYSTFEGAFVFEIIDIIMMNILNPVMLFIWNHENKSQQTTV